MIRPDRRQAAPRHPVWARRLRTPTARQARRLGRVDRWPIRSRHIPDVGAPGRPAAAWGRPVLRAYLSARGH